MQSTKVLSVRLVNDGMITQPSSPGGVLSPVKYVLVENGRKPEWSNVTGNQSHKPVMAAGSEGRAKTKCKARI